MLARQFYKSSRSKIKMKKLITLLRQGAIGTLILAVAFITVEPAVSHALVTSATSQFTISQTVGAEVGFATLASNVTMSPTLGGITGGTSNGATSVAVRTNDLLGYKMTIQASTSLGMQGVASSTNYIPAYVSGTAGVPDYTFNTAANGFGYNVTASTTSDVVQAFKSGGSTPCNTGSITSSSACWLAATSSPVTIINRNLPTSVGGATTTLSFMVNLVANNMLPNDTYVATTTLTATVN
jgi:hypothetical protein